MRDGYDAPVRPEPLSGLGSLLGAFDLRQARAEVEQECQARIALAGLRGVGKSSLINRLRGWEVSPGGDNGNRSGVAYEDLGLFVLLDLPDQALESSKGRGTRDKGLLVPWWRGRMRRAKEVVVHTDGATGAEGKGG